MVSIDTIRLAFLLAQWKDGWDGRTIALSAETCLDRWKQYELLHHVKSRVGIKKTMQETSQVRSLCHQDDMTRVKNGKEFN